MSNGLLPLSFGTASLAKPDGVLHTWVLYRLLTPVGLSRSCYAYPTGLPDKSAVFPSIYPPHLHCNLFGWYRALVCPATSPDLPALCSLCSLGRKFAVGFLQFPPHDGHLWCLAIPFSLPRTHNAGLKPAFTLLFSEHLNRCTAIREKLSYSVFYLSKV